MCPVTSCCMYWFSHTESHSFPVMWRLQVCLFGGINTRASLEVTKYCYLEYQHGSSRAVETGLSSCVSKPVVPSFLVRPISDCRIKRLPVGSRKKDNVWELKHPIPWPISCENGLPAVPQKTQPTAWRRTICLLGRTGEKLACIAS